MAKPFRDLTNQRFGSLVALIRCNRPPGSGKPGGYWHCVCDCGNTKLINISALTSGGTTSCGCGHHRLSTKLLRDQAKTQGQCVYFTGRSCKHGHIAPRSIATGVCVECTSGSGPRAVASREIYRNNRDHVLTQAREYYDANRSAKIAAACAYQKLHRKRINAHLANKRAIDIQRKLAENLRKRLSVAIKAKAKAGSAVTDLGCSITDLIEYISSLFSDGMNWENWGKIWQLDHRNPLSSFDLTDRQQFLKAAHFSNLQPLSIADHRAKTAAERRRR